MDFDKILFPSNNNFKIYLGVVTEIDENYLIKFKIPDVLENGINTFPTAYPITGQHIQEIVEDDSVLIIQPEESRHFFLYTPINLSNFTGIFFKDTKIDISDGSTIKITTAKCNATFDGENDLIDIETSNGSKFEMDGQGQTIKLETPNYSLGQFIEDLDTAFQSLHTEGSPAAHVANSWYSSSILPSMTKAKMSFPK